MRSARSSGFPVPEVYAVDGGEITMARVDGVDLLSRLSRRPWWARRVGVMLAELHVHLAAIPIGDIDLLPAFGEREALVHGDLHPGNIILTSDGPIVIDWEGAGVGPQDADTATTWLLLETAEADDVPMLVRPFVSLIRRTILRAFLDNTPTPSPETIAAICEERLADKNTRPIEVQRIREFAARHAR